MCLLYSFFDPDAEPGEFQLVLANGREEKFTRNTGPAQYLDFDDIPMVAGGDFNFGDFATHWVTVGLNGKVASVLNVITTPVEGPTSELHEEGTMLSKGELPKNFIRSKLPPEEFADLVEYPRYNPFHLCLYDIKGNPQKDIKPSWLEFSYENFGSSCMKTPLGTVGFLHSSNEIGSQMFARTEWGGMDFQDLVLRLGEKESTTVDQMCEAVLMEMADDTTLMGPDDEATGALGGGMCWEDDLGDSMLTNSYVHPSVTYGTRQVTAVAVKDDEVRFMERAMVQAILVPQATPYHTTKYSFTLGDRHSLVEEFW